MNELSKKEIISWLEGPRDHEAGVELYKKYGYNLRLKRQFAFDYSSGSQDILVEELRKLCGMSDVEFRSLRRRAVSLEPVSPELPAANVEPITFNVSDLPVDDEKPVNEETPETVKKMISFREKYTFLSSPDCPDLLKALVADMFTAYGKYKAAWSRLQELGDEDSEAAAEECRIVVEEYLKNREIWEELDYYQQHGEILGKAEKFRQLAAAEDVAAISDVDLLSKCQSARVQVSKLKKKLEKSPDDESVLESFNKWSETLTALREEVDRRKKK